MCILFVGFRMASDTDRGCCQELKRCTLTVWGLSRKQVSKVAEGSLAERQQDIIRQSMLTGLLIVLLQYIAMKEPSSPFNSSTTVIPLSVVRRYLSWLKEWDPGYKMLHSAVETVKDLIRSELALWPLLVWLGLLSSEIFQASTNMRKLQGPPGICCRDHNMS